VEGAWGGDAADRQKKQFLTRPPNKNKSLPGHATKRKGEQWLNTWLPSVWPGLDSRLTRISAQVLFAIASLALAFASPKKSCKLLPRLRAHADTVAILAQGTNWAGAVTQAFFVHAA
jgi:hypothetical protein